MLEQILRHFPPHVHPLTLVSDPDNVLADETVLAHLAERGFTVISEPDPVCLRGDIAQFGAQRNDRSSSSLPTPSTNSLTTYGSKATRSPWRCTPSFPPWLTR